MTSDSSIEEELDLAIPDMDDREKEVAVGEMVRALPGVRSIHLVEKGALVKYLPQTITADQITAILRRAGYRATIFQDSETGREGSSSV